MGVSDRDYMRRAPDRDSLDEYERRAHESEYGSRSGSLAVKVAIIVIAAVILLIALTSVI